MKRVTEYSTEIQKIMINQVSALRQAGKTLAEIARKTGLTVYQIRAILKKHVGSKKFQKTPKLDRLQIIQYWEDGMRCVDIANLYGVTPAAIGHHIKKYEGYKIRGQKVKPVNYERWKGGRSIHKGDCRVLVYAPLHPMSHKSTGRVSENRLISELMLGRPLYPDEYVVPLDGVPYHSWPDNLKVVTKSMLGQFSQQCAVKRKTHPDGIKSRDPLNTQVTGRCPALNETLANSPQEMRQKYNLYLDFCRPTTVWMDDEERTRKHTCHALLKFLSSTKG